MTDLRPLRIAFVHPDLGIGGAERLIVDAAVGLKQLGHDVDIYTSHWDPARCFDETKDGTLAVTVLGGSLVPTSWHGRFTIVCAILRQLHLTLQLAWLTYFSQSSSFMPPDIFVVDQLSSCIPLLRWILRTRVVFYCHFPDLLLSPGRSGYDSGVAGSGRRSFLRAAYRFPIDRLEEFTTGMADRILVNSLFTAKMFYATFPSIIRQVQVVYPGISVEKYTKDVSPKDAQDIVGDRPILLSINRFEMKKNAGLAIEAFATALKSGSIPKDTRLILAGGYDDRLETCVQTLQLLQKLADRLEISHSTTDRNSQILFLTNLSEGQKHALLQSKSTRALLYTPSFEHLGIGPLEAMACGLPVLAVNNGGPTETVKDGETGYLRDANKRDWAEAIARLVNMSAEDRERMAAAGRKRVKGYFDLKVMAEGFEQAVKDVLREAETGKTPDIWVEGATLRTLLATMMVFLCGITVVVAAYNMA